MQISWLGYSSFRITTGGVTVLTNPYEHSIGFKIHKQSADVVISNEDRSEVAKSVSGSPMIISQPGEYETKSIFVNGKAMGGSTIYRITAEDMSLAFIGSVKMKDAANSTLEVIEGVDVLLVPVGGGVVSNAKEAVQLINQVEPRIVIPSYYKIKGSKGLDSIDVFTKEYNAPREEVDKLKLAKSGLPQEETRVAILKQS